MRVSLSVADPTAVAHPGLTLRDEVRRSPQALFGAIAIVLLIAWLPASGAYSPGIYCAGGIGILILIVAAVASGAPIARLSASQLTMLGAALAFAAWNYASIGWAKDTGIAFDGANRTVLYVAVFALFALTPWTPRLAGMVVCVLSFGVAAVCFADFWHVSHSSHPETSFISARFASIVGYENASAALLMIAALTAVVLASRRETSPIVRIVSFTTVAAASDVTILTESRGAVAGTVGALIALLLLPGRSRSALAVALTAGAVGVAAPSLLHVYSASNHGPAAFSSALRHSFTLSCVSVALALLVGVAWVVVSAVLPAVPRVERVADRCLLAVVILALLAPVAAAVARPHDARDIAHRAWRSFAHTGSPTDSTTRFTSLGSNRYDAYRVSLDEFRRHPLFGVGSDNFAIQYLRHRRSDEELLYPHSDLLRIPLQTGLVGVVLGLIFLGGLAVRMRSVLTTSAATAVTFIVPLVYWTIHASVDWLWEVAGVTAPIAAIVGMLTSLVPTPVQSHRRPWWPLAAAAAAAVAVAVPMGADWFSTRMTDSALRTWRSDPASALSKLNRASSLDPFSDRPNLLAAAIAEDVKSPSISATELQTAVKRVPANWYTRLLLAVGDARAGNWGAARSQAEIARRLNPREETIGTILSAIRKHRPPNLRAVNNVYLARAEQRVRSGVVQR